MAEQIPSSLQMSQMDGESARMNVPQQVRRRSPFFIQRFFAGQIIKFSLKNIIKSIFFIIVFSALIWMSNTYLDEYLIKNKTPFKFGRYSISEVYEIASPDQTAYKSFYYFNKMVEIAKNNVKEDRSYQRGDQNEFANIDFWELYGIFKVVKAVQLANEYQLGDGQRSEDNQQEQQKQEQKIYQKTENLTAKVNLTDLFNPAADQASCGSCYSFPIASTTQYQYRKRHDKKIKLSEQQLIDCSNPNTTANGCEHGNVTRGFEYARDTGFVENKYYPYRSQAGSSFKCNKTIIDGQKQKKNIFKIAGFRSLQQGDCKQIQFQLVHGNAVAAMINVGRLNQIKNYSEPFRDCVKNQPNHAVTIVGQTQNQDWIIRNSWGQNWGNNGYYVIRKGNTCGICNHAIVPYLEGDQVQAIRQKFQKQRGQL